MPPELESLRALLGDVKAALVKEKLKSAELENKCAQLEESFNFKMSVKEKELVEVKITNAYEALNDYRSNITSNN